MSDYRDLDRKKQEGLDPEKQDLCEGGMEITDESEILTQEERMADEAMLSELRGAARAEVPERLRPENIGALLEGIEVAEGGSSVEGTVQTVVAAGGMEEGRRADDTFAAGSTDNTGSDGSSDGSGSGGSGNGGGDSEKVVRFPHRRRIIGGVAAACAAAYLVSPIGIRMLAGGIGGNAPGSSGSVAEYVPSDAPEGLGSPDEMDAFLDRVSEDAEVSDFLIRAKDYEEVYDKIQVLRQEIAESRKNSNLKSSGSGFWAEDADASGTGAAEYATSEEAAASDAPAPAASEAAADGDFSETNLREADVDEGDIVKTDGSYIYSYSEADGEGVRIVAIDGGEMEIVSEIPAPQVGAVIDMFISGDRMVLVQYSYDGGLEQSEDEIYYYDSQAQLLVTTYDISDRANPQKTGEITTDGSYHTSRISGGYFYLVTQFNRNPWVFDYARVDDLAEGASEKLADAESASGETAFDEAAFTASGDLPTINGETVPAKSIYLPDKLQQEQTLTLISVDLENPSEVTDTKTFYAWASDIYMTGDAIFLEAPDWNSEYDVTNIIRVEYANGMFHPTAAGTVPGSIQDAFAIDEDSDGNLRIATTIYLGSDWTNGVYIYDEYMHQIGRLTGLAKGEMIQSARFLDDICYLVTYRNMDPLFSIDVSDPKNPTLLGELEITGFSDYLHFWNENELLGLGLETDPEDGEVEGVKLTMFDVTDPANVTAITTELMKDMESADAMYNYKALLINPVKNIIGFRVEGYEEIPAKDDEDWDWVYHQSYQLYSYADGAFTNLKTITEEEEDWMDYNTRGIYAGSTFYLVGQDQIVAYDMNDGFAEIGRVK